MLHTLEMSQCSSARRVCSFRGEYLKGLRAAQRLTQLDISRSLGLPEAKFVGHWEAGRNWVASEHHHNLAMSLGVSPTAFALRLMTYWDPLVAKVQQAATKDKLAAMAANVNRSGGRKIIE